MDGSNGIGMTIARNFVDIRNQQRSGRKSITLVQGIPSEFSLKKMLRYFKHTLNCNGTIIADEEHGEILQIQGDRRREVAEFLIHEGIVERDMIRIHGS